MCRFFSVKLYFSYLSISSLGDFLDLSPCTFESYAHSLLPCRKQYQKCPRPFWSISMLEQQVESHFSKKNKPLTIEITVKPAFLRKTDRAGWLLSFHLYAFIAVLGQTSCGPGPLRVFLKTRWLLPLTRILKSMNLSS